jgi:hypothetical protein
MLRPLLLASLSSALLSGAPARRARVAGGVAPRATPCLECDPWQELATPAKYAELVRWYEAHARQSEIPEDLGRWGVTYREYVDEFVAAVAGELPIAPRDAVFESAVGAGWLLRGLAELLPREVGRTVEWCGNDIIPAALDAARAGLLRGEGGVAPTLCVGDSANLTGWVPRARFDATLCGYLEALPLYGREPHLASEEAWRGHWCAEMAAITRPGGHVFVGNIAPLGLEDEAAWWRDAAESDAFGWGVDPASVLVRPQRSARLTAEWGARYHVHMTRRR